MLKVLKMLISKGELLFSVILFFLGLIIVVSSIQIGFGKFSKPGPGLFPLFCGLILCVQSISLHVFKQINQEQGNLFNDVAIIKKFILLAISFVLWIVLMPLLGWLPLTFLVTFSISKIMQMEDWAKPLILSIINTVLLYFLFGYFLAIDLPNGFWVQD
jgi:hypothetical protein